MTCEVCGNDPVADARARDRQHEIKRQYRRALYLSCGGDKEKVKRMMSRAEDEMCQVPPNTVLRPSSNELGEAIDAAVEMIERADRLEKVESALSDLLNDLEERAKWNLEASQRVVACGNGVYVRAKAALEESK